MLEATTHLQLILGPDKRNPSFCLYTDAQEKELHVYYGLELLEVLPNDRDSPAYRLLAARLANANVRLATLEAVFGLDRKTMRTWGRALRSGDRDWLAAVLTGRWGRRKLTPALTSYVRTRWPALCGERNYRQRLTEELARVFGVKVSGETLRPLLRQLRQPNAATPAPGPVPSPVSPRVASCTSESPPPELRQQLSLPLRPPVEGVGVAGVAVPPAAAGLAGPPTPTAPGPLPSALAPPAPTTGVERAVAPLAAGVAPQPERPDAPPPAPLPPPAELGEVTCVSPTPAASVLPGSSKLLPSWTDWSPGQTQWCEHAGLFLFADALAGIGQVVQPAQPWLAQALSSVLAGALNLEQTKYLNPEDQEELLGPTLRGLGPQRQRLKELAAGPTADALLHWNAQRLGVSEPSDFYFDPHTKHYTGMAAVLKGWCANLRWADKALHSDFLHTVQGHPIYFECTDNYEDLRARLWGVLARARTALGWAKAKPLTLVIDRAVFGQETFAQVLAEPALHLITWQKGCQPGGWDDARVSGAGVLERPRNRAADLRSYPFRYLDQKWAADPRWRQLIVRATNPAGRTVEVAILTDDHPRAAAEVVRLIFGRWVQENDFKYLDQHFGINQITSYDVVEYAELKTQLTDRQVESGVYRALREQSRQVQAQLGRHLWAQRQSATRSAARSTRLAELAELAAPARAPASRSDPGARPAVRPEVRAAVNPEERAQRREVARLRAAQTREAKSRELRQEKITALEQQWTQLTGQAAQTQQTVSRLEDLITRQMVRLDTGPKRLLDALKVVARNEFYRALAPFRAAYDNYRDDHEHFRRLSQSAGVLRWNGRELEVHLLPAVTYGPTLRRVWEQVLEGVNAAGRVWPDGSGRTLRFRLAARAELQVSLRSA
jgi:hypothetical protein